MGVTGMYLVHEVQLTIVNCTTLAQKCSSCAYNGEEDTFLLKKNGIGHTKTCLHCTTNKASKQSAKGKDKENMEPPGMQDKAPTPITTSGLQPSVLSLEDCLKLLSISKDSAFELDAFVKIPDKIFEGKDMHSFSNGLHNQLAEATDYRWK